MEELVGGRPLVILALIGRVLDGSPCTCVVLGPVTKGDSIWSMLPHDKWWVCSLVDLALFSGYRN